MKLKKDHLIENEIVKAGTEVRIKEELNSDFWNWFGRSKVTESGKPKVLYHGTNRSFDFFDKKYIASSTGNYGHYGAGIYFSDERIEAETYGKNIMEVYLKMEKPFYNTREYLEPYLEEFGGPIKEPVAIDPDWLISAISKKDPVAGELALDIYELGFEKGWERFNSNHADFPETILDVNDVSEWVGGDYTDVNNDVSHFGDYFISELRTELGQEPKVIYNYTQEPSLLDLTDYGVNTGITDRIKADGYDGIIAGTEYIVFDGSQVKSVNNIGSWSKESSNIYESNHNITLWKDRSFEEKVESLMEYPYDDSLCYHVTDEENIDNILSSGIKGDEIWITKYKPHPQYNTGSLLAVDLSGYELLEDRRWSSQHNVFVVLQPITTDRIKRIFSWIPEMRMREDELAEMISEGNYSREKVSEVLKDNGV